MKDNISQIHKVLFNINLIETNLQVVYFFNKLILNKLYLKIILFGVSSHVEIFGNQIKERKREKKLEIQRKNRSLTQLLVKTPTQKYQKLLIPIRKISTTETSVVGFNTK